MFSTTRYIIELQANQGTIQQDNQKQSKPLKQFDLSLDAHLTIKIKR